MVYYTLVSSCLHTYKQLLVILSIANTGFNIYEDEICQIALCYKGAQRCFKWCEHVLPDKEFHEDATINNGFSKKSINGKNFTVLEG